jgi:glyceraldehyde 3-phosphate dehydrogenase
MIQVAINGFGRIGRAFVRAVHGREDMRVVAINDLGEIENLAYLLKYDSAYGKAPFSVTTRKVDEWRTVLVVDGVDIPVYQEKDPTQLPWRDSSIDVVVEATGHFTDFSKAKAHIDAGARKVVITAPAKGGKEDAGVPCGTVLMGINEEKLSDLVLTSNGSCTTNASAPVIQILHEAIGIKHALLDTIHAYTATQAMVDGPDAKDWRRGRAGAHNIIPSTTGAAKAVTEVVSDLEGKFDGVAMRVPVITGSVADITFVAERPTTVEEVNEILSKAATTDRWCSVFSVSHEELVSGDIIGELHASIADLTMTRVVDGVLVKVCAWYDNEMGYTGSLVAHVAKLGA